jgi:phage recombination protein Bet
MSQIEKSGNFSVKSTEEERLNFKQDEVELIKKTIAPDLNKTEFEYFLKLSKSLGLNPLLKQIWAVKFGNRPASIFTGRDGFLRIAHESGKFAGMRTKALIQNKNGEIVESDISIDDKQLVGAICYVYRTDWEQPLVQAVRLKDFDKGQSNWNTMKEVMIKKVAESMALRKAFSIYGVYAEEEFDQNYANKNSDASKTKVKEDIKKVISTNNNNSKEAPEKIETKYTKEELKQYDRVKEVIKENAKLHKLSIKDIVAIIKNSENIDVTNQASYSPEQAKSLADKIERANYQKMISNVIKAENLNFDEVKQSLEETFNGLETLKDLKEAFQELSMNTQLFK